MSDTPLIPVFFGVWIPGEGWLKSIGQVYADEREFVAQQVADCIGRGAKVLYVDKSIIDLESHYLEAERTTPKAVKKWDTLINLRHYLTNTDGK